MYFPETHQIKKVRRVVLTNEFLPVSKDANKADDCDDNYYQNERKTLNYPQVKMPMSQLEGIL